MNWFKIGKAVHQSCVLSPCLFNFYAGYIMWNVGLDETQDGIKIAGRNINNLRYAGNTTLIEESKDKLKSLLKKVKEESKTAGLKLNIKKTKITGNWSHHLMANRWGKNWNSDRLYFLGPWKKSCDKPRQCIKKQRHHFANKGLYRHPYSHVWMWELDHNEGWVQKNWCFWTVVLEKTQESSGLQEDQTSQSETKSTLNIHWKD